MSLHTIDHTVDPWTADRGPRPATQVGARLSERVLAVPAMGGRLELRVAHGPLQGARAAADLRRVAWRIDRWAAKLTRHSPDSDLAALNADPARPLTPVRPTLAAALAWAERAADLAEHLVDVSRLDELLAAAGHLSSDTERSPGCAAGPRWHLERRARCGIVVRHEPLRFDLGGVGKGWIADRALALLRGHPAALVDADGDVAVRVGAGVDWSVAIADPGDRDAPDLALLRLDRRLRGSLVGIATSGTSVHRWQAGPGEPPRHHLIDPRTGRPACTDVIQATVIAESASLAETLAKAVVIAGSTDGLDLLDRSPAWGAVVVLETDEVIALPRTLEWIA